MKGKVMTMSVLLLSVLISFVALVRGAEAKWYRGYYHYHTCWGSEFPEPYRMTPKELVDEFRKVGIDFAFLAGDHSARVDGRKIGDWYGFGSGTYPEYRNLCLANSTKDVLLIPAREGHVKSVNKKTRRFVYMNHCLTPWLEKHDEVWKGTHRVIFSDKLEDFVELLDGFIAACHEQNVSPSVEIHGGLVTEEYDIPFNLSILPQKKFDYFGLWNQGLAAQRSLDLYLAFLGTEEGCMMGAAASIDHTRAHIRPAKIMPRKAAVLTYVYAADLTHDAFKKAWAQRRTYAAMGTQHLTLLNINPVPSRVFIRGRPVPKIEFTAKTDGANINVVRIYNKGVKVYEDLTAHPSPYTFSWEDTGVSGKVARYVVHIRSGGEGNNWLITSPINFLLGFRTKGGFKSMPLKEVGKQE